MKMKIMFKLDAKMVPATKFVIFINGPNWPGDREAAVLLSPDAPMLQPMIGRSKQQWLGWLVARAA